MRQHEATFPQARVRHLQIVLAHGVPVDPEHVHIEGARAPSFRADPLRLCLEGAAQLQQLARRRWRVELNDQVQVRPLTPGPALKKCAK